MANRDTILFSQIDLTNSLNALKYINEFKKNFKVVFSTFSNSRVLDEIAAESSINPIRLPPLIGYRCSHDRKEIRDGLCAIEEEIGVPVEKVIFSDREFYGEYKKNPLISLAWFIDVWNRFEEIIEENGVSHHFCFGEDRLHNLIPYYLLKKSDGKSHLIRIVPYYGITFTNDFFGKFTFEEKVPEDGGSLEGKVSFEDYMSHVKESKVYFDPEVNRVNYGRYFNLPRLARRIMELEKINWHDRDNLYRNHNIHPLKSSIAQPLTNRIKKTVASAVIYGNIEEGQRYAYYPFHFTEDAQVRMKYPEGYNQYELVRNISRNLPASVNLIVKEHPAFAGNYSLKELYDLSRLPNVVVLNSRASSKDIMSYIDYVITINSTVGYEALFYDKVVITMGTSFYDSFPGVVNVKDVKEIYSVLTDEELMSKKISEIKGQLKERTLEMLNSSLRYDYYNFYSDENVSKVKKLFMHHIGHNGSSELFSSPEK